MLKIALTKGRIEKNIQKVLEEIGYDANPMINKDGRLLLEIGDEIQIVLVKSVDVVNLVNSGVVDLGIVGSDTIFEKPSKEYSQLLDFETGKCMFALCGFPEYENISRDQVKRIATKYPNITRAFFNRKKVQMPFL